MSTTLADVLPAFGAEYLDAHSISGPPAKVLRAVLDGRPSALRGQVLECPDGGHRE